MFSLIFFAGASGICYFPAAFQGEYVTQTSSSRSSASSGGPATVSYSSLSVLFDSIPAWGVCHRRIGNDVVLVDDTGGLTCYRCYKLALRSPNVVQAHTADLDKCYATEERAVAECPTDMDIRRGAAKEIMLYRKSRSLKT